MVKLQSNGKKIKNLLKVTLALLVVTVMLAGAPITLFAVPQHESQFQTYDALFQPVAANSIEIEPFSKSPTTLHWATTPNPIIVPMGQNVIDLTFKLEWAETPRVPISHASIGILFPYRSIVDARIMDTTPPALDDSFTWRILQFPPTPENPDILSGTTNNHIRFAPLQGPWWGGEVEVSARLWINHEHLQNPGDTIQLSVFRGALGAASAPAQRSYVTLKRGGFNLPCHDTNLACSSLGAEMTASSEHPQRPATLTNDGVTSGLPRYSWLAEGVGSEWLMVDFGQIRSFDAVRIYQAGMRISDYRFEYSVDGGHWNPFHQGSRMLVESPNHYEVRTENTIHAQFVRLYSGRSNYPTTPIAAFEFEVYYLS